MALKSESRGSPQFSFLYDEAQNFARHDKTEKTKLSAKNSIFADSISLIYFP